MIEQYVFEVTRRLPEKNRDDIALELQSTIEDMLPDNYEEKDIIHVLEKLGDPITLANKYRERPAYLIGPGFYDLYIHTLKMILPIAAILSVITLIATEIIRNTDLSAFPLIITIFGKAIWTLITTIIHVFFWVTLVFFLLERAGVSTERMTITSEKWKPEDLKNRINVPKKKRISKGEVFTGFIWTGIWATIYFNAIHIIGVYEKLDNDKGLQLVAPIFQQDVLLTYWPVIITLILLEVAFNIYKWVCGQWTMKLAIMNSIFHLLYTTLFIIIISNSELIHPSFITYMSTLMDVSTATINSGITWVIVITVATVIITTIVSIYEGFKKAKITS